MTELLLRGPEADELIARRRALGIDTYDEVWDGIYHVTPAGNIQHGVLQAGLIALLRGAQPAGMLATGPINVGTERNYRVPDAAVVDRDLLDLVWVPRALLVGEILSQDDDTYEKFDHYRAHGVEEILVVEPNAARVEIWTPAAREYEPTNRSQFLGGRTADLIWAQINA